MDYPGEDETAPWMRERAVEDDLSNHLSSNHVHSRDSPATALVVTNCRRVRKTNKSARSAGSGARDIALVKEVPADTERPACSLRTRNITARCTVDEKKKTAEYRRMPLKIIATIYDPIYYLFISL